MFAVVASNVEATTQTNGLIVDEMMSYVMSTNHI